MPKFHLLAAVLLGMPIGLMAQSSSLTGTESANSLPQRTCASHEKHVQLMGLPKYADAHQQIEDHTAQWAPIVEEQRAAGQSVVVTIPVVFHVLYANSTQNISDAQIQSQLDILNADFRRQNTDQDNIWSQAADTEIEFCLASFDPSGARRTGRPSYRRPSRPRSAGSCRSWARRSEWAHPSPDPESGIRSRRGRK